MAWTSASRSDFERSARLQGAALAAWESIPRQRPEPVRPYAARCEEMTQSGIAGGRWGVLTEEGRRLEPAAAVMFAMHEKGSAAANRRTGGIGSALTERELQVAELVAKGMTDREIAAELVISQRTAESHVQHILTKLGFRSRAQIAAWAATKARASNASRSSMTRRAISWINAWGPARSPREKVSVVRLLTRRP